MGSQSATCGGSASAERLRSLAERYMIPCTILNVPRIAGQRMQRHLKIGVVPRRSVPRVIDMGARFRAESRVPTFLEGAGQAVDCGAIGSMSMRLSSRPDVGRA